MTTDDIGQLLALAVGRLGGEERSGQVAMALAVGETIDRGHQALIQAGTGTGKSLAYLVPAVAHAARANARVVISTATLALQRQVFAQDLPLVVDALEHALGVRPRFALLKGRANYLCRHRIGGGYPEPDDGLDLGLVGPSTPLGREVARLTAWADQTDTGDRDDLDPGVSSRAWSHVSVGGRECLGQSCPMVGSCFAERALDTARQAQIVVTNHAMLAIEVTSHDVIGPRDALIVDEAHELVARITSGATGELTAHRIEAAARGARRCGVSTDPLEDAGRRFATTLDGLRVGRFARGLPEELIASLQETMSAAREAMRGVEAAKERDPSAAKVASAALAEIVDLIDALVSDGGALVMWLAPPDGDYSASVPERLLAAPLDVAALISERLLSESAVVLTSATLALGGSFDSMTTQLGMTDPRVLDAGSPFDYPGQGILYVASHLDRPGTGGIAADALDELEVLIRAAGGRTLGLFSSHRAAQEATDAMRLRLDVPILNQRDEQVPILLEKFKKDPRTCLFGSTTLWQGVDLPGNTCQLVVIDRIPFPRPDDPVTQARSTQVDERGGSGFMAVSATYAALMLAQGAGRLIRTMTDRGVVAVLDSRLATARYGGFLARSLPPMWGTTDRVAVLDALRRLDLEADQPAIN